MENMRTKHSGILLSVIAVLLICNLIAAGVLLGARADQSADGQTKYTLYIGTNDKDTYQQEIPFDECRRIVTEICTRHTGGCTLSDATGFWMDDAGVITSEQTIQCVLEDISEEDVHAIADEVIAALNQNSVMIETQQVTTVFYTGEQAVEAAE